MEARVVALGTDPVDLRGAEENDATAFLDGDAVGAPSIADVVEQALQPLVELARVVAADGLTRAAEGSREAVLVERLQDVVECMRLERLHRELVVCGHEDHDGRCIGAERFEDAEAVALGDVDVQEEQLRLRVMDHLHGRITVPGFRDDLDVGLFRQE